MDSVLDGIKVERNIGPAGGWTRQLGVDADTGRRVLVSRRDADSTVSDDERELCNRLAVLSRLRHPGLTPVIHAGLDDEGAYTVEQTGRALPLDIGKCALPRGRKLGRGLKRLVEALAYLHRHGLAHGAVSRRVVVSDGSTLRLSGVGLKHMTGAAAAGEDVVCWAVLVRDIMREQPQSVENTLVLAAATEVLRLSKEGQLPTAAEVAREIGRKLRELSEESKMDGDAELNRNGTMRVVQKVSHLLTSVLLGLTTTAITVAALVGVVTLGALWFLDRLPEEVVVPSVIGLSEGDARERLASQGLEVGNIRRVYREEEVPGEVVGTAPEVGMTVREGREITLIVSRGAAQVRVPRLMGLRAEEAREILEKTGLVPQDGGKVGSESAEGEIVRQEPEPGQNIAQGEIVQFFVSGGPQYGMIVVETDEGETERIFFRQLLIVVPAGDALQRVEVKEGYADLETTYDRLHRPGDEIKINTHGAAGKQITVSIEGEQVFKTQL